MTTAARGRAETLGLPWRASSRIQVATGAPQRRWVHRSSGRIGAVGSESRSGVKSTVRGKARRRRSSLGHRPRNAGVEKRSGRTSSTEHGTDGDDQNKKHGRVPERPSARGDPLTGVVVSQELRRDSAVGGSQFVGGRPGGTSGHVGTSQGKIHRCSRTKTGRVVPSRSW